MSLAYIIEDFDGEQQNVRTFYKKELQRANQTEFRAEKLIKKKGNKLHVK